MRKYLFLFAMVIGLGVLTPSDTYAANASDWRAGNIVSDAQFMDGGSMSTAEIQALLGKLLPACDVWGTKTSELGGGTRAQYAASVGNPAPFTCLTGYYEVPKTTPGSYLPVNNYGQYNANGTPYIPPGSKSAAQLISDAAIRYSISPKALLIKLATESAGPLTTDEWPLKKQYYYAMGAHCPDSGPGGSANCDINYSGFSMQIAESAKLLRGYLDGMNQSWWPYKKPFQTNDIMWNVVERGCGAGKVYIESKATAALYTYTPYQPNQAALNNLYGTGDYCSAYGNRNFWRVWVDWFGSTQVGGSRLFRSVSSSQVYALVDGYKLSVPSMAVLQDYGFDPASIDTLSDAYVNSISAPSAASGISSRLGYVIKSPSDTDSDGGAAYLVSRGKKYVIQSMTQFYAYGLKEADIVYLPLSYVQALSGSSSLSDYAQMPDGAINYVSNSAKQLILDYPTFVARNPTGSFTPLSEGTIGHLSVSNPLTNTFSVIKQNDQSAIYLYADGKYDLIPSMEVYSCLGIGSTHSLSLSVLPSHRLPQPIVSTATTSCLVNNDSKTYTISSNQYHTVPVNLGITGSYNIPSAILEVIKTRNNAGDLKEYVKSESATIWRLKNGVKEPIPTYQNYANLGSPSFSSVNSSPLKQIAEGGVALGDGTLVKTNTSPATYVISSGSRFTIPSISVFNAYGFNWNNLEVYSEAELSHVPINSQSLDILLTDADKVYTVSAGTCKLIPATLLTDYALGNYVSPYSKSISKHIDFSKCSTASQYIKSHSSSTVYKIKAGTIHPASSWAALVKDASASSPPITIVQDELISRYPIGQPL